MNEFLCRRCKSGHMVQQATAPDEMESSDTWECDQCGHTVTLPSMLMIISQLVCGIASGLFAAYLFIDKLSVFMTAMQFGRQLTLDQEAAFLILALLFLAGSGFILYQAFAGLALRKAYRETSATSH
ncbi:MAG: hypothetical protein D6758_01155 [Gammaproteobacteria bacterium]|nr:MAG: hypothetical protein D6758_01155 [Gammaproteobacteria bacterium]